MYCRVTWYSGSAETVETGIKTVSDMFPKIRRFPGYAGFALLVDRESGKSAAVSYFRDWKSLKASAAAAALVRRQGSDRIGGVVTGVDEYECPLLEVVRLPQAGACVRVINGTGRREKADEVIGTLRDHVVPVLKQQKGFCASIASTNRKTGKGFTCSIFDTKANLDASNEAVAGLRQQLQAFAEMADMTIHTFELVLSELPAPVLVAS